MNKEQFMKELTQGLRKLPEEEQDDILQDFHEHFAIGENEGKSEQDITDSLGSPQKIAKEMVATYYVDQMETSKSAGNMMRAAWAVIGLGFFNLIIVLGPFLVIASLLLAGWIISAVFIVSPILATLNVFIGAFELFDLFVAITLCGLGIFIGIGMYYATRGVISGFVRYLKYNIDLVKGGLN